VDFGVSAPTLLSNEDDEAGRTRVRQQGQAEGGARMPVAGWAGGLRGRFEPMAC
jgi:hypothetical protein